ncbi:MAG: polysaccharide deacetylase family protein [Proteobacteria bacterium]|nr:polysaccharide deacetylase family protein [Pseudomonadota bacterium]
MTTLGRLSRLTGNWIPAALARPFGAPTAVFFHGVEQQISDPALQVNQHRLDAFEDVARLLKRDFDVLPLSAMADVLSRPAKHARALFLMSDDGYANTLTTAAPVLKAYDLPWALFVSTHHIDTGEFTPPTLTRIFFLEAPRGAHDLPHFDTPVFLGARTQREAEAVEAWKHLKNMPAPHAIRVLEFMKTVLAKTGAGIKAKYESENFLTWDQVRALDRAGVEIGAHADSHWAMHQDQPQDFLREQALRPKLRIEKEIGHCRFFAYPFGQRGDIGRGAWEAVRDAGYQNAFTTIAGTLNASTNPWLLPRYGLAAEESNLAAFLPVLRANNPRLRTWQSQIGT